MSYRVGLIGAGGAGSRRAAAVAECPRSRLVKVCDLDLEAAARAAAQSRAQAVGAWEEVIEDPEVDIVILSATHDQLSPIGAAAAAAGKHLLCEKPLGRNPSEVAGLVAAAAESGVCLAAGYNHRFHPAVAAVRGAADSGLLGELDFIRARYGHGGRPGYDREWRGDRQKAGGGELLDQGAHLVDLCLWLLGGFESVTGFAERRRWDIEPLEDNAFGLFRTGSGQVASIHASWTQWKNLFSLEVFGSDGYAVAEGLGGSYGPETVRIGRRRPEGGKPSETRTVFEAADGSWSREWTGFLDRLEGKRTSGADGSDALRTMQWIYRLYRAASEGRPVSASESVA
ncbi:MAG: Gfo/Idh/MocA family oxidoreductase [Gemmatimonadetes bacterium]|nr:Gfo/Idh/MocA family oxidoreductase [Gemmatimonadota bacterium]